MPAAKDYGQINFRTQVIMLLPPELRSVFMVDWGFSLVKPLDTVMDNDWVFIYDEYVKAFLTGQKMVMQEGLNFLFKITAAPFIIIETIQNTGATLYMFNEAEPSVSHMYNEAEPVTVYMLNEAESTSPNPYNFLVKIPSVYATTTNLAKLATQVDLLKLTGKTYNIIIY